MNKNVLHDQFIKDLRTLVREYQGEEYSSCGKFDPNKLITNYSILAQSEQVNNGALVAEITQFRPIKFEEEGEIETHYVLYTCEEGLGARFDSKICELSSSLHNKFVNIARVACKDGIEVAKEYHDGMLLSQQEKEMSK